MLQEINLRGKVERKKCVFIKVYCKRRDVQNEKKDYQEGKEIHAKAHPMMNNKKSRPHEVHVRFS